MQEQELFQSYEIKNWDLSPRIYKILAASAIFNILALLTVAQSNLLTTKGCDSPLVGGVCQVIDTLVVGSSVLTTETAMKDEPFTPTELEDAEIIWVDRTGAEPFRYPEGYFALSNPESVVPQEIPNPDGTFPSYIPGITNPNGVNPTTPNGGGASLLDKPQELPKGDGTITGGIPDSPLGNIGVNPTVPSPNVKGYRPPKPRKTPPIINNPTNELPKLPGDETADANADKNKPNPTPTPDKSEAVSEVEINKAPLKTFAADVKTKVERKEVDLSQNFIVVADAVLTKEGKLDVTMDKRTRQPKSRILKKDGNPQMVELAEKAIAAIGDSGWLGYLRNQGVEKINFTVVQDNDNLQVIITSDQPTPERAKTMASGLSGIIQGALLLDKNEVKKLGEDEKVLLSNAKVTDNGKQFVLNFVLPKPVAQEMITRKLNEPEKPEVKPQSTAQIQEKNKASSK